MQVLYATCKTLRNYSSRTAFVRYGQVRNYLIRLQEVGHLETPKETESYKTGQMFLHKLLGYRGVVLFPWLAKVFDRDVLKKTKHFRDSDASSKAKSGEGESSQTFYNVLIDSRDTPYIRSQSEVVTFFDSEESGRGLIVIPGMDFVAHKNILPYTSTEEHPLQHELLNKFFQYNPERDPPFVAEHTLRVWESKNQSWLELTKVHQETTEMVRVTVIPFYMGCRMTQYWWRYSICVENLSDLAVRLRERHWRIFTKSGALESLRGRGVMGQEVILSHNDPVFQYSSHVSLDEPSGHMWGTFFMEREDGLMFNCMVPSFNLQSTSSGMVPPPSTGCLK